MYINSSVIVLNVFFFQALELILCFCVFSVWCNMRKQVALMAHSREELQVNIYAYIVTDCLSVVGKGLVAKPLVYLYVFITM